MKRFFITGHFHRMFSQAKECIATKKPSALGGGLKFTEKRGGY